MDKQALLSLMAAILCGTWGFGEEAQNNSVQTAADLYDKVRYQLDVDQRKLLKSMKHGGV